MSSGEYAVILRTAVSKQLPRMPFLDFIIRLIRQCFRLGACAMAFAHKSYPAVLDSPTPSPFVSVAWGAWIGLSGSIDRSAMNWLESPSLILMTPLSRLSVPGEDSRCREILL
jgi:hypothetical protein